jgi:hypothetical protein
VELRRISGALITLINGQEEAGEEEDQWQEESSRLLPRLVAA